MSCQIRELHEDDLPALAGIYRAGIRQLGAQYYSDAQIEAWACFADDTRAFAEWITGALTLVAEDDRHIPLGFGGLQKHGRISALFVAPQAMRQGIGTALVQGLIDIAAQRKLAVLTTDASEFSRPVFERFGFSLSHIEHTTVRGVAFRRYVMTLRLP